MILHRLESGSIIMEHDNPDKAWTQRTNMRYPDIRMEDASPAQRMRIYPMNYERLL